MIEFSLVVETGGEGRVHSNLCGASAWVRRAWTARRSFFECLFAHATVNSICSKEACAPRRASSVSRLGGELYRINGDRVYLNGMQQDFAHLQHRSGKILGCVFAAFIDIKPDRHFLK